MILQGSGSLSDGFHETLGQQVAGKEFGQVPGVVVVVLVNVAEEVDEPVVDVDPGGLAAAHRGVHHGGVVVPAEEIVLAPDGNASLPIFNQVVVYPVAAVHDIAAEPEYISH